MNRQQQIERMVTRLRDEAARQSTDPALRREAADLLATIAREAAAVDPADVETVRRALDWYVDEAQPLNVPGRQSDAQAFERIVAAASAKTTTTADAVAILNHMIANPSDCDFLGPTDPETGVRECNRRGGDCLCAERMEALEDALERISRGKT